ncbi:long-chain-fatty-acid--CoA ligase 1b [Astyanax mexicanus]|uniref:Long-chain-fatty-acid--CoA ligase n=1 Tax=Astyanax mexicanus TaxID=7994 RepID=W5LH44_ASTMX|nr:long-chain-fatty-acid--CoA ligase 1b [Astyanax mexicanus]XP_022527741.1 long-chain-fatty-acid--CoA ligase 1b [Astyanax mexicanus]XP_022527742.1 long-chain-fatty-acid--CoA ligase 1b [Astyanax mexicanus]
MQAQELLKQLRLPELDEVRQYVRSLSTRTLVGVGAFAAVTTYLYATRPKALKPPCDLHMQSLPVPGEEFARMSALMEDGALLSFYYDDATTMYECFTRGMRVSNNGRCLGARKPKKPYEWLSYSEVAERAANLGSALLHSGHSKNTDQYIGIFAQNRPEWTITELACYTYSLVAVPLYDTLGAEAIDYIMEKTGISTVVCDVAVKAGLLLDGVSGKAHSLRMLIVMEEIDAALVARGQECGVKIISMKEAENIGKAHRQQPVPPKPDDMAIICFTSGTTGNPKGAMLTHRNIVSNVSAFTKITETSCPLSPSDSHISYLPLAHMFERVVQGVLLVHGGSIGFFQGDIRVLMDDLTTLRPTVFPVVPRLLNRMFDKIYGQANTPLKKWVLEFAFRRKEAEMMSGIMRRNSFWDKAIFKKVQASVGGCVRLMMTGAAPVSAPVLTFLRAALGCQFYEGYGQTECTAGCSVTLSGDWSAGHVGPPLPCNYVKLVDVAEMNYLAVNGEGEVCVKGPNVFKGYLKDPEKTEEAIDKEGWVHTGDIGRWLPNGTLKIVDRKKHIFKLAQGEYIAPEKIENIYIRCEAVVQAFVHGDSLQACLVAIIIPDPDFLPAWANKKGFRGSYKELCSNKAVKTAILEDILKLGKESGLKSFEQVKDIALHTEMFSVQNGLLTPTLKAKRADLRNHFRQQIDELYSHIHM